MNLFQTGLKRWKGINETKSREANEPNQRYQVQWTKPSELKWRKQIDRTKRIKQKERKQITKSNQ
jgi:hypothetical protein